MNPATATPDRVTEDRIKGLISEYESLATIYRVKPSLCPFAATASALRELLILREWRRLDHSFFAAGAESRRQHQLLAQGRGSHAEWQSALAAENEARTALFTFEDEHGLDLSQNPWEANR